MFDEFELEGNRPHIRLDEELVGLDKNAADEAFKKNKRMILDAYLIANGFMKYKANAYVRKNRINVLEYIDLQKERYGSKTFTVNYAIMPLYVPHEYLVTGFGGRLGSLICKKDIWWDYANEEVAQLSFQNVADAIERFLMPWFEQYVNEECLLEKLHEDRERRERTGRGNPYKNEEWISAFAKWRAADDIISQNISALKLPKKLI